ncbi:hypothetical protein C0J52_26138 [Blattella germanica]|nr:hypothetical protein C0J52_26138 [Blattella germanica]
MFQLPDGVELTLSELQEMACRQQHQIDSQHQLLVAKEQRLRFLKQQEARHHQVAAENERLRRLRDRVEAQELKLRKLRALRGQVDQNKLNNASLTSDLDSIRAQFNEKEKELSLAVAKVEELTRQLEEHKRGRGAQQQQQQSPSPAALELEKLRRELLYRNKLNEQQNVRLCQQREQLSQRHEEMSNIDKRISELQDRLHRKRMLNQQMANQISAASHKQPYHHKRPGNIAAIEPYHHVPLVQDSTPPNKEGAYHQPDSDIKHHQDNGGLTKSKEKEETFLPEFGGSKSDPKYQTLPYNTKFTVNFVSTNKPADEANNNVNNMNNNNNNNNNNINNTQQLMTVHSTPIPALSAANKGLATPLSDQVPRPFGSYAARGQPVGGTSSTTSSTSSLATSNSSSSSSLSTGLQKPVSSVAPTSVQHQKPSPIYQTSSTKIHPVQPQTLSSTPQGMLRELSPPQSTSTPVSTPDGAHEGRQGVIKPALPPKPALPVKPTPPPRQTQLCADPTDPAQQEADPPPPPTTEPPDESNLPNQRRFAGVGGNDVLPIIKARPLTIKKQPPSELPKLKSVSSNVSVSINRRIEMPPAFLFPETEAPPADLVSSSTSESGNSNSGSSVNSGGGVGLGIGGGGDEGTELVSESSENNNVEGKLDITNEAADSENLHIVVRRVKKGNLKAGASSKVARRVSFDPLALLLDASLEGELELVRKTATQVSNPSAANDEGITALHNAICAGHLDIVKFLVEFGCDVNAQDSDGWTPLHCAASCNNLAMVRFLVEHGACIFATTLSDHETAAEKCEEDEEGFDGCSEYLYSVQEKLGILNNGVVYAVYDYEAHNADELGFKEGDKLVVLRKGDEWEREWWWSRLGDQEGYVPRNLLGASGFYHFPLNVQPLMT